MFSNTSGSCIFFVVSDLTMCLIKCKYVVAESGSGSNCDKLCNSCMFVR
jgi:hypothetical protein